jgi:ribose transport system ATP-binding protein
LFAVTGQGPGITGKQPQSSASLARDDNLTSEFENPKSNIPMPIVETAPLLECRGIGKQFGGVAALRDVDFSLFAGEVHGVVGSNGAGKSTLMRILAGVLPDHRGEIVLGGRVTRLGNPQTALSLGIAMVYQELSGVGQLSVAENIFLGRQPLTRFRTIDWRSMQTQAQEQLAELGIEVDVWRRLDRFPLGVRQMVEIARGIHRGARILILDEPTSALSPIEARRLFELIALLREKGVAIVFISHFIEDVLAVCDRVTILRNGELVETRSAADLDKHDVIEQMLGRQLRESELGYEGRVELPARTTEPPRLTALSISTKATLKNVGLQVSPGECLGLYGFAGAGHQKLVRVLAGVDRPVGGTIYVDNGPLRPGSTNHAVRRGVVMAPADRAASLFLDGQIYQNVTIAHLRNRIGRWLTASKECKATGPLLRRVGCRPPDPRMRTGALSGGNQQKVSLARWLMGPIRVLLLEEPTRGMDVGAKEEVMQLVAQLKDEGAAIVLASSEPEMLLTHADRILVLRRGEIVHEFEGEAVDKADLMRHA